MIFSVKRRDICLTFITLLSFWSAFEPTESHVLRKNDYKSNSSDANEGTALHFKKLANTHNLHNPCTPGRQPSGALRQHQRLKEEVTYTELTGLRGTPGNRIGLTLLRELITKSTFLQGLATNVIRMVSLISHYYCFIPGLEIAKPVQITCLPTTNTSY